jgi:UrcA family protein
MFVSPQITRTATLLVAASASLVAPTMAYAQERPVVIYAEPSNVRTERVSFASLDLAKAADQKRLHFRVAGAVERVCLRDVGRDGLQDRGYYACESNAWGGAAPQIADAIARASEIAMTGSSSIAATAITVSAL